MRAPIIAIANQKGGTGKTTTALNLGDALARQGRDILLVDMDHQASLTRALGIREPDELDNTITQLLMSLIERHTPEPEPITITRTDRGGTLDLIASNVYLSRIDIPLNAVRIGRETILKRALEPLRDRYDAIILDCAPALNTLSANEFIAADGIIIPSTPQFLSVKGLDLLIDTYHDALQVNPTLRIIGTLITMREPRRNAQARIHETLREASRRDPDTLPLFDTVIPKSVDAEEAPLQGRSIIDIKPHGKTAKAYRQLALEVIARLANRNETHA